MNGLVDYGMSGALFPENRRDEMLRRFAMSTEGVIPARVISYDRATHRVLVEPVVKNFDRNKFAKCPLYNCTVWRMYCGRYLIDVPIEEGDSGWIIAADRDTSTAKVRCVHVTGENTSSLIQYVPDTDRVKCFEFGFFIPDRWGDKYNTDAEHNAQLSKGEIDEKRLVIQSADGTQRISIGQCDIKIWSTNTTINTTSDCTINANASVMVNAKAEVDVKSGADVSVTAENVKVNAKAVNFKTDSLEVSGGIASKASASGTLSAGSVAQVKDGLIVSISNA